MSKGLVQECWVLECWVNLNSDYLLARDQMSGLVFLGNWIACHEHWSQFWDFLTCVTTSSRVMMGSKSSAPELCWEIVSEIRVLKTWSNNRLGGLKTLKANTSRLHLSSKRKRDLITKFNTSLLPYLKNVSNINKASIFKIQQHNLNIYYQASKNI